MLNYQVGASIGAVANIVGTIAPRYYCDGISNSIFYSDTHLNWLNVVLESSNSFIAWGWGYSTASTNAATK